MQGLPERWVNYIIADPDDHNHAYIAFSGFRQGDDAANVWETKDGGATWQNISYNMPNGPVEMLEYDPKADVLFAATDVGVFDHKDGDPYWYKISVGMPQVPVLDLKLRADGKGLMRRVVRQQRVEAAALHRRGRRRRRGPGTSAGTVPATLSLTLGAPAAFGAFTPGVAKDYTARRRRT